MFSFLIFFFLTQQHLKGLDDTILKKSDAAFFPKIAELTIYMELFENDKYQRYYEVKGYIKGNRKYLAVFQNPPLVRKRAHLRVGNIIWEYFGKINKTMRISAKANFSNSVFSEEDILNSSLEYYYRLMNLENAKINGKKVLKLSLINRSDDTAYKRIDAFIDPETYLPVKRDYYSFSDQKIKELIVKDIRIRDGQLEYVCLIMYDLLRKGRYTKLEMKDIKYLNHLPDRMFTRKYLEIAIE